MAEKSTKRGGSGAKNGALRAQANRIYYLRNRERLIAKAKRRYAQAKAVPVSEDPCKSEETDAKTESKSLQNGKETTNLLNRLVRWLS